MASSRPPFLVALGRALKARRAELGITQEELAHRSSLPQRSGDRSAAPLARSYISGVEAGAINLSVGNAKRLADAVELSLSELFARAERLEARSS